MAARLCREAPAPVKVLGLADGEIDFDRVYRGNRRDRPARRVYKSAYLKLSLSRDAVDGGDKRGKAKIDLSGLYGRFVSTDLRLSRFYVGLRREVVRL